MRALAVACWLAVLLLSPAAATASGISVFIGSPTIPAALDDVAHIWVDTDGGTCADLASLGAYSDEAACGSMDAANDICEAGDVVRVKNGAYSGQAITGANGRVADCTIVGESQAGVTMPTLTVQTAGTGYITLQDFTVSGARTGNQSVYLQQTTNVTFDGVAMSAEFSESDVFKLGGGTINTLIRDSDICCVHVRFLVEIVNLGSGRNQGVTFEDTDVHGATRNTGSDHTDAWLVWGSPVTANLTLDRVRVFDHAGFGMNYSNGIDGFVMRQTVWEWPKFLDGTNEADSDAGKQFDGCGGGTSDRSGWFWLYNIIEGGWTGCSTAGGMTLRGNLGTLDGGSGACSVDADNTWIDNTWSNGSCTGDDAAVADLFSDLSHWEDWTGDDFRPTLTSPAIDAGDSLSYPATDALGVTRFLGAGPDAGPYEVG